MKSLRDLLADLLHAAALIAFTVAADALTRPPEPQLGLPGEDLIEPEPTPIHDALQAEWRRNANDYARAVTDLEYVQTVDDLAVVGGWDA